MAENTGGKYLELLVNASNRVRAWQLTSYALMGLVVVLTWGLLKAVNNTPVRLVPYEYATEHGYFEVKPGGMNSQKYMGYMAESDVKMYFDWTRDTIERQYQRFMNRMTPEGFSSSNITLQEESERLSRSSYSQAFFPAKTVSIGHYGVRVEGMLNRWAGERLVLQNKVTITLNYVWHDGMPKIGSYEVSGFAE